MTLFVMHLRTLRSLTASKPTNTMTQHDNNKTTDSLAVDSASAGSVIARLVEAANEVQRTYPTLGFLFGQEMKDALEAGNDLQQAIRAAENLLAQNKI